MFSPLKWSKSSKRNDNETIVVTQTDENDKLMAGENIPMIQEEVILSIKNGSEENFTIG